MMMVMVVVVAVMVVVVVVTINKNRSNDSERRHAGEPSCVVRYIHDEGVGGVVGDRGFWCEGNLREGGCTVWSLSSKVWESTWSSSALA